LFAAAEQRELAALGYGITTLVARASARAQELTSAELTEAVPGFTRRVSELRPRWVGFLGITAYRVAFRRPKATIGRQDERVADAGLWVLPNPSGLNRSWQLPALTAEFCRLYRAAQDG
jgi:TDG/mug DNA glycosylase family protein